MATTQILTQLYTDFLAPPPVPAAFASASYLGAPRVSIDPTVRRTMFLTVFASDPPILVSTMPARLEPLRLGPLSLKDAADVLTSAFVEKHAPMFEYLRREGVASELPGAATRKVTHGDLRTLAEDVAVRCLTLESKGKTLKRLCDVYPTVRGRIVQAVLGEHEVKLEHLALLGEAIENGEGVQARLARHMGGIVVGEEAGNDSEPEGRDELEDEHDEDDDDDMESVMGDGSVWSTGPNAGKAKLSTHDLGGIGLEPLTTMIRRDEQGARVRRRYYNHHLAHAQINLSSRMPTGGFQFCALCFFLVDSLYADPLSVARWIKSEFGVSSSITATFLTHAIINGNYTVRCRYPPNFFCACDNNTNRTSSFR
jgi:hypothetical protein